MNIECLTPDKDPMGAAIRDYHAAGKAGRLRVFSSQFEEDEIPVAGLFRTYGEMPVLERKALDLAEGRILDVGAGSGCHSLVLKERGKEVLPIDISPLSVEVMRAMLMNGSGIIGRLENIGGFFNRMRQLLAPGGCVLMDSSDLRYLFEDEDGSFVIDLAADYYGQVDFRMQYRQVKGDRFDWLYIDFNTLSLYAAQYGFKAEMLAEGEHYDYLARLTVGQSSPK